MWDRIIIRGKTASFRDPLFMVGLQPSLPVPPPTTVYGLISAACGELKNIDDFPILYMFSSNGSFFDLEKIHKITDDKSIRSDVIRREILLEPQLTLYVPAGLGIRFKRSHFPLLLGRSSDLATVVDITYNVELEEVHGECVIGNGLYQRGNVNVGEIKVLPIRFSDTVPRRILAMESYCVVKSPIKAEINVGYVDTSMENGIAMQLFSFNTTIVD